MFRSAPLFRKRGFSRPFVPAGPGLVRMLPINVRGFSRPYGGHEPIAVRSAYFLDTVSVRSSLPRPAAAGRRRPLGTEDRISSGSGGFLDLRASSLPKGTRPRNSRSGPSGGRELPARSGSPPLSRRPAPDRPRAGKRGIGFAMPLGLFTDSSRNPLEFHSKRSRKRTRISTTSPMGSQSENEISMDSVRFFCI